MELYSLRKTDTPGAYIITKFNADLEVESSYLLTHDECACPRGRHRTCRHRIMLGVFKQHKHIGDGWFLDYHTRQWLEPSTNHDYEPEIAPEQEQSTVEPVLPSSVAPASPAVPVSGAPKRKTLGLRGL